MLSVREKSIAAAAVVLLVMAVALLLSAAFRGGRGDGGSDAASALSGGRPRAVQGSAGASPEGTEEALLTALGHPNPRVVARAVRIVGRRNRRDSLPHLEQSLRDSRPQVRAAAAAAMGKFRLRESVDVNTLTTLLDDPDEAGEVRAAAAQSLGRMRIWQAMPSLVDALEDPDPLVRGRAGASVRRMLGVDFGFRANASLADRERAVRKIRSSWQGFQQAHLAYLRRLEENGK